MHNYIITKIWSLLNEFMEVKGPKLKVYKTMIDNAEIKLSLNCVVPEPE